MKAGHDDSGLVAAVFNDVLTEHAMWNYAPEFSNAGDLGISLKQLSQSFDPDRGGFDACSKIRQFHHPAGSLKSHPRRGWITFSELRRTSPARRPHRTSYVRASNRNTTRWIRESSLQENVRASSSTNRPTRIASARL